MLQLPWSARGTAAADLVTSARKVRQYGQRHEYRTIKSKKSCRTIRLEDSCFKMVYCCSWWFLGTAEGDVGTQWAILDQLSTYLDNQNVNLRTLTNLVTWRVITKTMATKNSGSGLTFSHLKCLYSRSGQEGMDVVFKTKVNRNVRVKSSKNVIEAISKHF